MATRPPAASSHILVGGDEVGHCGFRGRVPDGEDERGEEDSEDSEPDDSLRSTELCSDEECQADDHRPDEVELFFDRQRPEMLHR